jgi:serine/threonine protein kinase
MARTLAGRYRLTRYVASGATGDVWQAVDGGTDRPVAVKLLHPHLAADARLVDRLRQARRSLTGLWHPGIARLIDLVVTDSAVALVTDFAPGADLGRLLATGPLAPDRAARIAAAVADALDAAHGADMVHGDLMPSNVIVPAGTAEPPRLTDFSVATLLQVGPAARSSPYAAPWVIDGAVPTPASDVHALGVVLFEMLTGAPTYRPGDDADVDRRLLEVVDRCVLGDQAARPSAGAVSQRLRELAPQLGSQPPAPPRRRAPRSRAAPAHSHRTRRRTPLLIGSLLAAVLVVAVALVLRVLISPGPANPPPTLDTSDTGASATVPALPQEASASTQAGGGEFVRHWFAVLSYAVQTGDTAALIEATSPDCLDCQVAVEAIEAGYLDGGSLRGGAYVVRGVSSNSLWSVDRPIYDATVDRSPRSTVDAGGVIQETLPALSFANCVLVLEWADERWQVREVVTPGCVA